MNDTQMPWCAMPDELLADFTTDDLLAVVGVIELNNALAVLAQRASFVTLRAWAIGGDS